MSWKPTADRLAVKAHEQGEREESGIIIPESVVDDNRPQIGTVIAVGKDVDHMEPGDEVLYAYQANFTGPEVEVEGHQCLLMEEQHVLAIIRR